VISSIAVLIVGVSSLEAVSFLKGARSYARIAVQKGRVIPVHAAEETAIVALTGNEGRIPAAIELLRETGVAYLIISGTGRDTTLAELLNKQDSTLIRIQDIWSKILLDAKSTSTFENARETASIARGQKISRLILVTSDFHMRRALVGFQLLSPDLEIIPYPVESDATPILLQESFFSGRGFLYIWYEYLKSLALKIRIFFEQSEGTHLL